MKSKPSEFSNSYKIYLFFIQLVKPFFLHRQYQGGKNNVKVLKCENQGK